MGRNYDLTCYYCGDSPHYGQLIAIVGWGVGGVQLLSLTCERCGVGEYIPTRERVASDVRA